MLKGVFALAVWWLFGKICVTHIKMGLNMHQALSNATSTNDLTPEGKAKVQRFCYLK